MIILIVIAVALTGFICGYVEGRTAERRIAERLPQPRVTEMMGLYIAGGKDVPWLNPVD